MEQQQAAPNMAQQGVEAAVQAREQAAEYPAEHPELEGAIAQMQGGLDLKVQEIRDDRRLTPEEQRAKITDLWNRVSEAYPQVIKNYERMLSENVETAEKSLFYITPANRQSFRSAYNDAYDRTAPGFDSGDMEGIQQAHEELERLWQRAVRTGDRELRHAVGQIAIERGMDNLRDVYLATSKEKSQAWGRFTEARKKQEHFNDPTERLHMNLMRPITFRKPEEA
jgi:hypothetical protein